MDVIDGMFESGRIPGKELLQDAIDSILEKPDFSTPVKRRRQVDNLFSTGADIVDHTVGQGAAEAAGLYGAMATRRKAMILLNMDKVAEQFAGITGLISAEHAFARFETSPHETYNSLDYKADIFLAAAIWILDELRRTGKLRDAYQYLPKDYEDIMEAPLDFHMVSYEHDLISSVSSVLRERNGRGLFIDEIDAKQMKPDTERRRNFDALLGLLEAGPVEQACARFRELQWDILERRMRCIASFDRKSYKLADELQRLVDRSGSAVLARPENLETEVLEAVEKLRKLEEQRSDFMFCMGDWLGKPRNEIRDLSGSRDIADALKDFRIEDPYEICFAALYMIASGDDAPWLVGSGTTLAHAAAVMLPWYVENEPEEEWYEGLTYNVDDWNSEPPCDEIDFYHTRYNGRNLAQIIYDMCRAVPPRGLHPFRGKQKELVESGVDEKTAQIVTMISDLLFLSSFQAKAENLNDLDTRFPWLITGDLEENEMDPQSDPEDTEKLPTGGYWGTIAGKQGRGVEQGAPAFAEEKNLEKEIERHRSENKSLRQALSELNREAKEAKARYEREMETLRREHRELADLRELVFNREQNDSIEKPEYEISYPYRTKHRVVCFGGHESFLKTLRPMLPDVRFIEPENYTFNPDVVRNADIVWIQTNCISHTQYGRVLKLTRQLGIQLRYFAYASAEKCAEQLVMEDRSVTGA